MVTTASFAGTAALIGDPARAAMLHAVMDGRALTAGELARAAGVTAQTASSHLAQLTEAGLLCVEKQGRHRYHRLATAEVARLIEGLMQVTAQWAPVSIGASAARIWRGSSAPCSASTPWRRAGFAGARGHGRSRSRPAGSTRSGRYSEPSCTLRLRPAAAARTDRASSRSACRCPGGGRGACRPGRYPRHGGRNGSASGPARCRARPRPG